jgi:hypothetical protein
MPPLKTWRRIQKLVEAKIVEGRTGRECGTWRRRSIARRPPNFVPGQFLDLKPNDERLGKAFKTYLEVQKELMNRLSASSDIPKGENPTDYAIYASAKSFCQLLLDPTSRTRPRDSSARFLNSKRNKASVGV